MNRNSKKSYFGLSLRTDFLPQLTQFIQHLGILHATHLRRLVFFLLCDALIVTLSLYLAFCIRFDFTIPLKYQTVFLNILPCFISIRLMVFFCFKVYKISWKYLCLSDFIRLTIAQTVSFSLIVILSLYHIFSFNTYEILNLLFFNISLYQFPKIILFVDALFSFSLFSALRASKRVFYEIILRMKNAKYGKRTIILGAGNTADMIIRDMQRQHYKNYYPVGLLDDNKQRIGTYVHGLKVLGTTDILCDIISKYRIDAIIIAIPQLNHKALKRIYDVGKSSKVDMIKIIPRIYGYHKPDINIKELEDISIEDLIRRQKIEIDYKGIEVFLRDKVILITGAGGSIGSEISMQVCAFQPERVVLFDIDETELHNMMLKLKKTFPHLFKGKSVNSHIQNHDKVVFITGDIRDEDVVDEVFRKFKPQIVFHAAAYKHVPMMEISPKEAVKVNIFGTYRISRASAKHHVEKFIMVSTDKAVRPTSIMGATKRMAEYIGKAFNDSSDTSFISVRFGNVLGSRGSVLPTFLEQLRCGGPLTVTHKDIQRYFMTIPEAVSLVLQASVLGKGGEILVLDMGEPIKILTLAEELIKVHGMQPYKDIDIEFTGLRPGEKLFEELLTAEEGTTTSKHNKIFIAKNSEKYSKDDIEKILKRFEVLLREPLVDDNKVMKQALKEYVKYFDENEDVRENTPDIPGIEKDKLLEESVTF